MNASKENCQRAKDCLSRLLEDVNDLEVDFPPANKERIAFIHDFLDAAQRKLPKEESYNKKGKKT